MADLLSIFGVTAVIAKQKFQKIVGMFLNRIDREPSEQPFCMPNKLRMALPGKRAAKRGETW
jgi:hypothetical protein